MQAEGRAVPGVGGRRWPPPTTPSLLQEGRGRAQGLGPGARQSTSRSRPRPRTIVLADLKANGKTLDENEHASLIDLGDRVACLEFHTKANIVGEGVQLFIEKAIAAGRRRLRRPGHRQPGRALLGRRRPQDDGRQDPGRRLGRHRRHLSAPRSGRAWPSSTRPSPSWRRRSGACWAAASRCACTATASRPHADVAMGLVETGVGLVPVGRRHEGSGASAPWLPPRA